MSTYIRVVIFAIICCIHSSFCFGYDEFSDVYFPNRIVIEGDDFYLHLKGRMQIGLHDLEGKGGPGYDSITDTQTVGTRSPFVALDAFDLAFRVSWHDVFQFKSVVSFSTSTAWLDSILFSYSAFIGENYHHTAEAGYGASIVAIQRDSSRYPLVGSKFWRHREFHAAYLGRLGLGSASNLKFGFSLGMMRPLKALRIHDSSEYRGTFSVMGYGDAEVFSGNSVSGTILAGVDVFGVFAEFFGFLGRLSTQAGIDRLVSDFMYYRYLPKFNPDTKGGPAYWAGGRLGYEGYGLRVFGEFIYSVTDLIREYGWYLQGSYVRDFGGRFFSDAKVYFRYEQSRIFGSEDLIRGGYSLRSPESANAISWDYDIATVGIVSDIYRDFVSIRLEYSFIQEMNGVSSRHIAAKAVDNNELLLQLEASF